jgi:hypothetical protein
MNCKLLKLKKMNLKSIIILSCLCCFSCSDNPIKEYQLDKKALIKAQKAYENSTIQHQKVQSKSIITITKNEKKVLATIEIYQNWELDTLKKRFKPVENEAEAKLTYFDGEYQVKPHAFTVEYDSIDYNEYFQPLDIEVSRSKMNLKVINGTGSDKLPIIIDFNNIELKKGDGAGFSNRHGLTFDSKIIKNGIIQLKTYNSSTRSQKIGNDNITIDFEQVVIIDSNEMKNLNSN